MSGAGKSLKSGRVVHHCSYKEFSTSDVFLKPFDINFNHSITLRFGCSNLPT